LKEITKDGTPCAVKIARTVWSGGKAGDYFKGLPIAIKSCSKTETLEQVFIKGKK